MKTKLQQQSKNLKSHIKDDVQEANKNMKNTNRNGMS
jgi:hypothetical protein